MYPIRAPSGSRHLSTHQSLQLPPSAMLFATRLKTSMTARSLRRLAPNIDFVCLLHLSTGRAMITSLSIYLSCMSVATWLLSCVFLYLYVLCKTGVRMFNSIDFLSSLSLTLPPTSPSTRRYRNVRDQHSKRTKSRDGSSSGRSVSKPKRVESVRY